MTESNTTTASAEAVSPVVQVPNLDQIRTELTTMSKEQLVEELLVWRSTQDNVQTCLMLLLDFQKFAPNSNELALKIREMSDSYTGAITLKDQQINELMKVIEKYQADPIGVGQKIEELGKLALKRKLN